MSGILEVSDISHHFGGLKVLHGVSFSVKEGTICGLIGPNGAGKSTLFNIISGFLRPTDGTVVFAGQDMSHATIQARSRAGLVRSFQTPQVFHGLTVRENLMAGFHKRGRTGLVAGLLALPATRRERQAAELAAANALERFFLQDVAEVAAGNLPAGKQRMVELARAVVGEPNLLCLDEPSSGLSSEEVVDLMASLRRLNSEGLTILLVSHDMELMKISSRIHALCFGRIITSGDLAHMQADPQVRDAYLGT